MTVVEEFDGSAGSVALAREFAQATLHRELGIPPSCALLVTSELASNAVIHAPGAYKVAIEIDVPLVIITVFDGSDALPGLRPTSDTGGRGLTIIDALSQAWGAERTPSGKAVWARLSIQPESPIFATSGAS